MIRKTCIILALLAAILCTGSTGLSESGPPGLVPVEMISVDGYELTCSWDLAENIAWAEDETTPEADLIFSAGLREGLTVPVFTMTMLVDQSDHVKVLPDPQGNMVPIGFKMVEAPGDLTAEEQLAFSFAQDEVHLLLRTLTLTAVPEVVIEPEEDPNTQMVRIVLDECELSYSNYYADKLLAGVEGGSLVFRTPLAGEAVVVFTVNVGSSEGSIVTMLTAADGSRIPVGIQMARPPETITGADVGSFYTAQGAVNDILTSITLR